MVVNVRARRARGCAIAIVAFGAFGAAREGACQSPFANAADLQAAVNACSGDFSTCADTNSVNIASPTGT